MARMRLRHVNVLAVALWHGLYSLIFAIFIGLFLLRLRVPEGRPFVQVWPGVLLNRPSAGLLSSGISCLRACRVYL